MGLISGLHQFAHPNHLGINFPQFRWWTRFVGKAKTMALPKRVWFEFPFLYRVIYSKKYIPRIAIHHFHVHGSWFMVHRRPLTTHWACKGQVGCAIPLVAPAGRCNARMNINKNKYKSNRKLKWNRHRPQWFRRQQLSQVFLHLCQIFKANELDSASYVSDPSHLNRRFKARMEKDSIKNLLANHTRNESNQAGVSQKVSSTWARFQRMINRGIGAPTPRTMR